MALVAVGYRDIDYPQYLTRPFLCAAHTLINTTHNTI
jgi:hypothetical protein